jgi:hypothetical protein
MMKRKHNPIIAAAKRGLREGHLVLLGKWDEQEPQMQLDIVRRFFTDEAIYEIGCLILGALVAGDKQMVLTVRDAIKEADHMFGRDREKHLLIPALRYVLCNWGTLLFKNRGDLQRSVEELKRGIEQHCNNGKKLDQHRWTRLRRALWLPKRSCVRHDRKPVKLPEVEIIDLAPQPQIKNNKEAQRRKREATEQFYRDHYEGPSSLQKWAKTQILLDMIARGEFDGTTTQGQKNPSGRAKRSRSTKRRKTVC